MKKVSLLLVALLCSISFYGQTWDNSKPDKRFTFGIRAGANLSSISAPEDDSDTRSYESYYYDGNHTEINYTYRETTERNYSVKMGVGFHAGFNVDINLMKSFAIQTGLLYSQQRYEVSEDYYYSDNEKGYGGVDESEDYSYSYEYNERVDYVKLPVLALFRLYLSNDIHIQLKAGGFAGYLVYPDGAGGSERLDYGVVAGAGLSYKKFYIGGRFEMGLSKDTYMEEKSKNIALSIGYDF